MSGCGRKAKSAVWRGALTAVAEVIGALGIGIVLVVVAAPLMRLARGHSTEPQPIAVVAPNVPAPRADPATLAV